MSKPAPYRLLPETYPFRCFIQTRYADLDVNKHLNNVAIATLFEEGRVRLLAGDGKTENLTAFGAMVVSTHFNYVREGVYGVDVEMRCGIAKIGNTSWEIHAAAFQNGVAIATCDSIGVHVVNHAPTPITEAWRAKLNRFAIQVAG